eukprot:gb/GECH01011493.1/.p1 GENE.gb/GECH01011493.1/~~gb/GECH01011493.1/.p1  ORF type:complete len:611 (+),score=135.96 gb/GECH01011493.1/:1-1833(+)
MLNKKDNILNITTKLLLVIVIFLGLSVNPTTAFRRVVDDYPDSEFLPFTTPNGYSPKQEVINFFLSIYAAQVNANVVNAKGEEHHGSRCVACTLVVAEMERLAILNSEPIDKAVSHFCKYLPEPLRTPCSTFVNTYGKTIIKALEAKETPDVACRETTICWKPQCNMFPTSKSEQFVDIKTSTPPASSSPIDLKEDGDEGVGSIWHDIIKKFKNVFDNHVPLEDYDDDKFSLMFSLRGNAWRGRDCNDISSEVYPGRRVNNVGSGVDHNCNGIYGKDESGKEFEEKFCGNSQPRGTIILGDSASAHFRIPNMWVNASLFDPKQLEPAASIVENEMDWPHLSWSTGHMNDTTGLTPGPVDSIYLRLLKRNRCNHRDYQNIGVNGARTSSLRDISKTMARDQKLDNPAVVFYAPIGNDVCSPHENFHHMTTPAEFYKNVMETMHWLDTVLPSNSHVVFIGLVDGRYLWNHLHNRTHPIGRPYPDVYQYLSCYGVNPCWGWLNKNETIRNFTSHRAAELSDVYKKVQGHSFKNFNTYYYPFPIEEITKPFKKKGGHAWQLIEPVDGFHPSQIANSLLGKYIFESIDHDHPEVFGPENPHNEKIQELFGDQGGY